MNTNLNINYSYTEAALKAIDGDRADDPAGAEGFMTYRCSLHMLFLPHPTYLVSEAGMFWTTEVVSVCANNHVWFCTMDEWQQKRVENPGFHAAEIFDPVVNSEIDANDEEAVIGDVEKQKMNLRANSLQASSDLTARVKAALEAAVTRVPPATN